MATSGINSSLSRNLLNAASKGDLPLLKRLVEGNEAGALMEVKDKNGRSLLHLAAGASRTPVCKYLVENLGFDVNVVKDNMGDTPLHIAINEGQNLTAAYLLYHGANPNEPGFKGMTALHVAAEKGRKDQLRLLLSKGAQVDAPSSKGTPLQCACASGMKDSVKILLDHQANKGADPNVGRFQATPLFMAASDGLTEITKCLLKAGADPNVTNFHDLTPLESAAMNGNLADVMALFDVTRRIPNVPVWSVHGIFEFVNSEQARNQRKLKVEEKFREAKAKGAEAVKRQDYHEALFWYTEARMAKPMDAIVLSNRSLCFAHLNDGENALKDASLCIKLKNDWHKAYYCAGVAWKILKDYKKAAEAFGKGLGLEPKNKELQAAFGEAMSEVYMTDIRVQSFDALSLAEDLAGADADAPITITRHFIG